MGDVNGINLLTKGPVHKHYRHTQIAAFHLWPLFSAEKGWSFILTVRDELCIFCCFLDEVAQPVHQTSPDDQQQQQQLL